MSGIDQTACAGDGQRRYWVRSARGGWRGDDPGPGRTEDMRILRDMLVSMLILEDDIKVVAQVADGAGVVPAALAERPDLAVLDIDMPEVDGLTAAAELHEQLPACRVVILTVLGRPGQLRQALSAHVSGFLVKDTPSEQLVGVLRRIAAGERVIDPKLALATLEMKESPLTRLLAPCTPIQRAGPRPDGQPRRWSAPHARPARAARLDADAHHIVVLDRDLPGSAATPSAG